MKIEKTGVRMEQRGVCTGGGEWIKLPPGGGTVIYGPYRYVPL